MKKLIPIKDRLLKKRDIDFETRCWNFTGTLNDAGYGLIWSGGRTRKDGRMLRVHRVSYEIFIGPVPEGLELDHVVCDNRKCFNPWHLAPKTHKENILRGYGFSAINSRKTHCPKGHEYDFIDNRGKRVCRICKNETNLRYWHKKNRAIS